MGRISHAKEGNRSFFLAGRDLSLFLARCGVKFDSDTRRARSAGGRSHLRCHHGCVSLHTGSPWGRIREPMVRWRSVNGMRCGVTMHKVSGRMTVSCRRNCHTHVRIAMGRPTHIHGMVVWRRWMMRKTMGSTVLR